MFIASPFDGLMVFNTRHRQLERGAPGIPLVGPPRGLAVDDFGRGLCVDGRVRRGGVVSGFVGADLVSRTAQSRGPLPRSPWASPTFPPHSTASTTDSVAGTPLLTPAIVIGSLRYSETSRIVRLATREHGVVSAIANGALRPRSRFGAALQLLSEGQAHLLHSRSSELHAGRVRSRRDALRPREES